MPATAALLKRSTPIHYPESDGQPMAENVEQYNWIVKVKTNLHVLLDGHFVAGDLFWYPVEGDPAIVRAPDVLVALGRPPGPRQSFLQWEEGGHPPDVVFEIWSPSNRFRDKLDKFSFYQRYGVREFISWNWDGTELLVYLRQGEELKPIQTEGGWASPLLGVHFELLEGRVVVRDPQGRPFEEAEEILRRAERESARAEQEKARAEQEKARAEQEKARAEQEKARADALMARLRALGVEP